MDRQSEKSKQHMVVGNLHQKTLISSCQLSANLTSLPQTVVGYCWIFLRFGYNSFRVDGGASGIE